MQAVFDEKGVAIGGKLNPVTGMPDMKIKTDENLIVLRKDGKFAPGSAMTRGEAAVVLYRMFKKIW